MTRCGHGCPLSAAENRAMFDRVARRYDVVNTILSLGLDRYWRRRAVEALAPRAGESFLDAGCGTGKLAIETLRGALGACATGVDVSQEMLAIAARRVRSAGVEDSVTLAAGDVLALEFQDGEFDGAITAFCLRNVSDRARAFRELRRVVRPGGRIVVLELAVPAGRVTRALWRLYNRVVVRSAGRLVSQSGAYRYLVESVEAFPSPAEVDSLMMEAGWADMRHEALSLGIVILYTARCEAAPGTPDRA